MHYTAVRYAHSGQLQLKICKCLCYGLVDEQIAHLMTLHSVVLHTFFGTIVVVISHERPHACH